MATNKNSLTRWLSRTSAPEATMGNILSSPAKKFINTTIRGHQVVMFSKVYCPYCISAKNLLEQLGVDDFLIVELDTRSNLIPDGPLSNISVSMTSVGDALEVQKTLEKMTGLRTVPNIFINGKHIGGSDELEELHKQHRLEPMLAQASNKKK